jgi:hypothetical protein
MECLTTSNFPAAVFMAFQTPRQGCQMVYLQTKNRNLDKFWRENVEIFYGHLTDYI